MKTKLFFIISLLILFLLSSCGTINKGVKCYSFSNGKNQNTHIPKFAFKKRKPAKSKTTKISNNKLKKNEKDLNDENSLVLNSSEQTPYLKTKKSYLAPSGEKSIPPFSKNISSVKAAKNQKKESSRKATKNTRNIHFYEEENAQSKFALVKSKEGMLLLYSSLIGALMAGLFWFNQQKMRNISKWAKENSGKAITAITIVKVSLILSGLFIGKNLAENDFSFSDPVRNIMLGSYLAAALFYPSKRGFFHFLKQSYFKQKIHDLTLVLSGFFIMVCLGNKSAVDANFSTPTTFVFQSYDDAISDNDDKTIDNLTFAKGDLVSSNKKPEKSNGAKVVLTILAGLGFLALMLVVAGLACGIACNGQEALAVVLLIAGAGGLIIGLIFVLKNIHRKD